MRQNYIRRLLKQPHPQLLTHDQKQKSLPEVERYWTEIGRRLAGGGKTLLMSQELARRHLKTAMFGPRYSRPWAPLQRTGRTTFLQEMSYADLEKRALAFWEEIPRHVGAFDTKELRDNAFGGGL